MTPLKIGACLRACEIGDHRDWLFGAGRDIELQDFMTFAALTHERKDRITAAKEALRGHKGRIGIHGPYEGLDIDNKDAELRPLITLGVRGGSCCRRTADGAAFALSQVVSEQRSGAARLQ